MNIDINTLIVQMVLIISLMWLIVWFYRVNTSTTTTNRFKKYCVEPINDNTTPFLEKLHRFYVGLKRKFSKFLVKSASLKKYSKKYENMLDYSKINREDPMDYVSTKFIWAILCSILIILSDVLRYQSISISQVLTVFLVGFFVPDIYWISKRKIRKAKIEKAMLDAIIIMNNAFKSGLSIMQAIYMVSNELDGPISDEFRKMYIDISFGLDMDLVFERFARRVNTEEAKYISTSLSVLNKTGGNIVQVFASVERSAFTRKKLKEELGALSSSANAIYRILVAVPILLTSIIVLLNPNYFSPLFKTSVGRIILSFMILIYISYILIIRKIIKMKE